MNLNRYTFQLSILSLVVILAMMASCTGQKKTGKYDHLRNRPGSTGTAKAKEPYEKIDIAVLDTTGKKKPPVKVDDNDKSNDSGGSTISSKSVQKVLKTANSYIGTRYKYGGTSRSGIDCSGLMLVAFSSIKKRIPRTSSEQSKAGKTIKKKKIAPGDLVFFSSNNTARINHVGLVTKVNGQGIRFIHATVSKGVREDELTVGYWSSRYRKAVRL